MRQTGVAHTVGESGPEDEEADFRYLPRQIRGYLGRLLLMERQLENIFRRSNIEPLRMSYETLTTLSPQEFIPGIAAHIGASIGNMDNLESGHQKTGGALSEEYIARFRREHKGLVAKIHADRSPTLDRLAEYNADYFARHRR
jgi:LPS sulfotransferase NodH